eukprot:746126-Prorocentrum_minimum.AAC.3
MSCAHAWVATRVLLVCLMFGGLLRSKQELGPELLETLTYYVCLNGVVGEVGVQIVSERLRAIYRHGDGSQVPSDLR